MAQKDETILLGDSSTCRLPPKVPKGICARNPAPMHHCLLIHAYPLWFMNICQRNGQSWRYSFSKLGKFLLPSTVSVAAFSTSLLCKRKQRNKRLFLDPKNERIDFLKQKLSNCTKIIVLKIAYPFLLHSSGPPKKFAAADRQ